MTKLGHSDGVDIETRIDIRQEARMGYVCGKK